MDMSERQPDPIATAANAKFTAEEIDQFISMGASLTSKAVLSAAVEVLKEGPAHGFPAKTSKRLVRQVEAAMPCKGVGFVSCEFREIPEILAIHLVIVPRDYKAEVDIPHADYAQDLFAQYNFLKNLASAYWAQFVEQNQELYTEMCEYRADVNWTLTVDPNSPTTMYFDPASAKRVGLFAAYRTPAGQMMYKRG